MKKPDIAKQSEFLTSKALERQMLGLSIAEYEALTPFEVACELKAAEILRKFGDLRLQILDEHLARLEILANGYQCKGMGKVEDFRLVSREGAADRAEREKAEYEFLLNTQRRVARFKKRRAELLAKREAQNGD